MPARIVLYVVSSLGLILLFAWSARPDFFLGTDEETHWDDGAGPSADADTGPAPVTAVVVVPKPTPVPTPPAAKRFTCQIPAVKQGKIFRDGDTWEDGRRKELWTHGFHRTTIQRDFCSSAIDDRYRSRVKERCDQWVKQRKAAFARALVSATCTETRQKHKPILPVGGQMGGDLAVPPCQTKFVGTIVCYTGH